MLRRTQCSLYSQLRPVMFRLRARSTISNDDLAIGVYLARYTVRTISTRHENSNPSNESPEYHTDKENTLKPDTQDPSKDTNNRASDGDKQTFKITPRFQWPWRWSFSGGHSWRKEKSAKAIDSQHFVPRRSEQRQNDLNEVVESLGKMAEQLRIPSSPLEKAVEEAVWKPKRQPTLQEKFRLSYNPWAVMLAGRMRLDVGSKVRLPEPLLLEMGVVTHPVDGTLHLLPDDLANLEAYDERLKWALRRKAMTNLHRGRGGTTLRMLPYKKLVDALTDEFLSWDVAEKRGRTKAGIIAKRLIPRRWMERSEKINAYQEASNDYWKLKEKLGETNEGDDLLKRPEPPLDATKLQWQPNVAERIRNIMRQRLLLSLDHLGRKTDEAHNIPRKHFMCFEWPKSQYINIVSAFHEALLSQHSPDALSLPASERNNLLAEYYATQTGESSDPGDGDSSKTVWKPRESAFHLMETDVWVPGSFFLHIGPPSTTLTALPYLRENQPTDPSDQGVPTSPNTSKFIPPMLAVSQTQRLPIFNLLALLGPQFETTLRQILSLHEMVIADPSRPEVSDGGNDTSSAKDSDYLILIRGTAPGAHYIVQELWQLWRYLGGTDCLLADPEAEREPGKATSTIDMSNKAASSKKRATPKEELERIKRYRLTKQNWDAFRKFLPGVERPPSLSEDGQPSSVDAAAADAASPESVATDR